MGAIPLAQRAPILAGEFLAGLGHPVFDHLKFNEQIVASLGAARR